MLNLVYNMQHCCSGQPVSYTHLRAHETSLQHNNAIEIVRTIVIILKYAYLKAQTEEDAHSA